MPIDPSIALGVKPIQLPNAVDLMTKQAQYRNMIGEGQLQQQTLADNQEKLKQQQIQTAKAQVAQHGQEALRQAFVQTGGVPEATIAQAIKNGADPDTITAAQKHFADLEKQKADTTAKDLENNAARNNQILPLLDQAQQLATSNPQAYMQAWPQLFARFNEIDPATSKVASPDQPATPQQLATAKALHMTDQYFVSQETQKRANSETIIKQNDEARKEELQPSLVAEARGKAVSATPNSAGLNPEQAQTAQQAADTLAETKLRDAAAAKVAQGELGIKQAANSREEKIYQQTYGEGANQALVGVDPKLRVPAVKEAQKAADEYQTAQKTADVMQSMLEAARNGNKAAGSNLPLVGVETLNAVNGIKRISRPEVDQYQGAGNLLDRIQGKVGKLVTGQPIPSDVLDDIEKMHNILRENSTGAYNARLSGINQNYKANFQPVKGSAKAQAPSSATIRVKRKSDGKTGTLDPKDFDSAKYDKIQ